MPNEAFDQIANVQSDLNLLPAHISKGTFFLDAIGCILWRNKNIHIAELSQNVTSFLNNSSESNFSLAIIISYIIR